MQGISRERTSLSDKEKEYETLKNIQNNIEEQLKQLKHEEEIIISLIKEEESKKKKKKVEGIKMGSTNIKMEWFNVF